MLNTVKLTHEPSGKELKIVITNEGVDIYVDGVALLVLDLFYLTEDGKELEREGLVQAHIYENRGGACANDPVATATWEADGLVISPGGEGMGREIEAIKIEPEEEEEEEKAQ